eukprot:TRINITY_DN2955_c0_g1_i1.p1 TRINITY_DN2955_c0_g1~~TRINITY_DN2955_c0_g1_i1.p1  ORF type:complete len:207 (+),score=30.24 TRINITY_DN2955_c0_g1_i1:66-623(+)
MNRAGLLNSFTVHPVRRLISSRYISICTHRINTNNSSNCSIIPYNPTPLLSSTITTTSCVVHSDTRRYFSSSASSEEDDYHEKADEFIEELQDKLQHLEEINIPDFDLEYSNGVLTVSLGKKGTYVFNKQSPNRQIWWSSPISGPKRFEYDSALNQWVNNRDRIPLLSTLSQEIKRLCDYDITSQ